MPVADLRAKQQDADALMDADQHPALVEADVEAEAETPEEEALAPGPGAEEAEPALDALGLGEEQAEEDAAELVLVAEEEGAAEPAPVVAEEAEACVWVAALLAKLAAPFVLAVVPDALVAGQDVLLAGPGEVGEE